MCHSVRSRAEASYPTVPPRLRPGASALVTILSASELGWRALLARSPRGRPVRTVALDGVSKPAFPSSFNFPICQTKSLF